MSNKNYENMTPAIFAGGLKMDRKDLLEFLNHDGFKLPKEIALVKETAPGVRVFVTNPGRAGLKVGDVVPSGDTLIKFGDGYGKVTI